MSLQRIIIIYSTKLNHVNHNLFKNIYIYFYFKDLLPNPTKQCVKKSKLHLQNSELLPHSLSLVSNIFKFNLSPLSQFLPVIVHFNSSCVPYAAHYIVNAAYDARQWLNGPCCRRSLILLASSGLFRRIRFANHHFMAAFCSYVSHTANLERDYNKHRIRIMCISETRHFKSKHSQAGHDVVEDDTTANKRPINVLKWESVPTIRERQLLFILKC